MSEDQPVGGYCGNQSRRGELKGGELRLHGGEKKRGVIFERQF